MAESTTRNKAKYSNKKKYPGQAINPDGDNEAALVAKIIAFMSKNGFVVWRQSNTGAYNASKANKAIIAYFTNEMLARESLLKRNWVVNPLFELPLNTSQYENSIFQIVRECFKSVPGSVRGVADIIGYQVGSGKFVAIEIKINQDELSEFQVKWANELKDANGVFLLARTYDQFLQSFYRKFPKVEVAKEGFFE